MSENESGASGGDYPAGVPDDEKSGFDEDPVNADTKAEEEVLTVPSTDRDDDIPADAAKPADAADAAEPADAADSVDESGDESGSETSDQ